MKISPGNAFKSMMTPRGASAAAEQNNVGQGIMRFGADTLNTLKPLVNSQIGFANQLEPQRQAQIRDLLTLLQPGNQMGMLQKQLNSIRSNTSTQVADMTNQLQSNGMSQGAIAGAVADANNNATAEANNATTTMHDPNYQAQLRNWILQLLTQGQQISALAPASNAAGIAASVPKAEVDPGFGEFAGQVVGGWASGGFKK